MQQAFHRPNRTKARPSYGCKSRDFFIFLFFLQKYIFVFEIYRNIPRPPLCRAAGTWPSAAGRQRLFCKKFRGKFTPGPLEDRSPSSGAAGPQATRQQGGWIWPPSCGATTSHSLLKGMPPHLGCPPRLVQKFQKKILGSS